jgi:Mrp family chromosome partitioning ATPase
VDKIFGLNRVPGLSDFLLGTRTLDECIRTVDDLIVGKFGLRLTQWSPGLEYLHIMPAGGTVENPAELLQSAVFDDFIRGTRDDFDIVIVDVSPVLPVADSYVIAPHVDGILLTYQIGRVARDVLHRTKQRLESLGANVLGIVMNDIRSEIDYKQGDFQYYQYRYEGTDPAVESLAQRLAGAVRKVLSGRKKR